MSSFPLDAIERLDNTIDSSTPASFLSFRENLHDERRRTDGYRQGKGRKRSATGNLMRVTRRIESMRRISAPARGSPLSGSALLRECILPAYSYA